MALKQTKTAHIQHKYKLHYQYQTPTKMFRFSGQMLDYQSVQRKRTKRTKRNSVIFLQEAKKKAEIFAAQAN